MIGETANGAFILDAPLILWDEILHVVLRPITAYEPDHRVYHEAAKSRRLMPRLDTYLPLTERIQVQ